MKRWLMILWCWSLLLTFPITVAFFYWAENTVERYATFGVRYNPAPDKMSLIKAGKLEGNHLLEKCKLTFLSLMDPKKRPAFPVKTLNVFISKSDQNQLNSNLPHSGFDYKKGLLDYNNKLKKVKIRYRGDFLSHWGFFKKSLRIKTKKKSLFEGMRSFNINTPKGVFQLHNYLGYRLASYLDLMAPRSEMINLNLNGKQQGLYLFVEQLEELTLRHNGRIPGDVYVGELVGKDAYTGVTEMVFEHPGLWKKIAVNNHYPKESRKPLEQLIRLINAPPSAEVQAALGEILDMTTWGRFSAFETLGQTFHFDHGHNWRLYYDPMLGKFEPIIWDPICWAWPWTMKGKKPYPDMIRTRLHKALFRNGSFLRARQKTLELFFKNEHDKHFLTEVDQIIGQIQPVLAIDPNLSYSREQIQWAMIITRESIGDVFSGLRDIFYNQAEHVTYAQTFQGIDISIAGRQPIQNITLRYVDSLREKIAVSIQYTVDGKQVQKDVSGGVSIRGSQLDVEVPLMAYMEFVKGNTDIENRLNIHPGNYSVIIKNFPQDNPLLEVLTSSNGSPPERAQQVKHIERTSFVDIYDVVPQNSTLKPTVWQGQVKITGTKVIENELVILPGTTVYMSAGASLILKNRLIAEGTKNKPIAFVPDSKNKTPWGTVVLKGQKANGSRLTYCDFSQGSGLKKDLFEYTAMLSIHDVQQVAINRCRFKESRITDDMVHIVYSDVRFTDCTFTNALSDGLDVDISKVVVNRCTFSGNGNDAIDLMTSEAVVIDTAIYGSGDKAISAGEGSRLFAVNDIFQTNAIGLQAKDASTALLFNTDIINNNQALDAYKKNWRYGNGGQIFFHKGRIARNKKNITADKKSNIKIFDSFIDETVKKKSKHIQFYLSGQKNNNSPQSNILSTIPEEQEYIEKISGKYFDTIDPTRIGASLIGSP